MNAHPFSLRQLQYAVAIAETRGFRTAAERCHVSQPSLSAQIAQLEEVLGGRLFERERRRVLVTAPGEELLIRARRVLAEADDLLGAARQAGDPLSGTLRVGVIPTVSPSLLPDIVPALRREHTRLVVLWEEEKTGALLEKLREGRLDAGLLALVAGMDDLEHETLGEGVGGGAALTLLPALSVEVENRRGELALRDFAAPRPSRTLVLAWRKQSPRGAGLREVAATIRQARRRQGGPPGPSATPWATSSSASATPPERPASPSRG